MRKLLHFIAILFAPALTAQPLYFENYSSEHGLSQNSCYSIVQDETGYLWFGTQDGLNRWDGRQFKVFPSASADGNQLPSNHINSLYYDTSNHLLWIGTLEGLSLYRPQPDSISSIGDLFPFAQSLGSIGIKKIVSFSKHEYWLASFDRGLFYLNTKSKQLLNLAIQNLPVSGIALQNGKVFASFNNKIYSLEISGNSIRSSLVDVGVKFPEIKELHSYGGSLWVGTLSGGCYFINMDGMGNAHLQQFEKLDGGIGAFANDKAGNLWIGTRGMGIYVYNGASNTLRAAIHNAFDKRSISKNFILSFYNDRQGIMWVGTSGGGFAKHDSLRYQIQSIHSVPSDLKSLPDDMVFTIARTKKGNYYVGSQNGGLAKWDKTVNGFKTYSMPRELGASARSIYGISEDDQEDLWLASWGGLLHFNEASQHFENVSPLQSPVTQKLYTVVKVGRTDSLLTIGENGAAFYSLKKKQWRFINDPSLQEKIRGSRFVHEEPEGVLWICSQSAGLVRYDYRSQDVEEIKEVSNVSRFVRHLAVDKGRFWLGTDNGLLRYDVADRKLRTRIIPGANSTSKVCYAVQIDKKGMLWVSTNMGIYKIDPLSNRVEKNYNLGNGLLFLEYNTACAMTEPDGTLIFGGTGGITRFNPMELKENKFSPRPIIMNVWANEGPRLKDIRQSHGRSLSLKHKENFLRFEFSTTNYSNQENNLFTYQLKGLSNEWSTPSTENFATYNGLPPGEYVFSVRSGNSDGLWSNQMASVAFTIHSPWWKTGWFLSAAAILLTSLIIFLVRKRIKMLLYEARVKQQMAELEIKGLQSQINRHFLFNALNSIKQLIVLGHNDEASRYLSKFAKLVRLNLDNNSRLFVTVRENNEQVKAYLEMESLRFNNFQWEVEVDEEIDPDDTLITPMLIQPLIENAIWHGLLPSEGEKLLRVQYRKNEERLYCVIDDNGIGIKSAMTRKAESTYKSVGLQNTRRRIEQLQEKYHQQYDLTLIDKSDLNGFATTGTVTTLSMPLVFKSSIANQNE